MSRTSDARRAYISETFKLSRVSLAQWEAFLRAFREHVAGQLELAVASDPATAQVAHGRAQAYLQLRDEFIQIESLYEQANGRQSQRS